MKTILLEKTKSILKISFVFLAVMMMSLAFNSCEADDAGSSTNCEDELVTLSQILADKSQTYSANPTESNCNAVRSAALKLIARAEACGYAEYYQDQADFWINLDCSENGGGGGGGGTTGNAMFWTSSDMGCGNISVSLNGSGGTISSYYSSGSPSCGSSGCANFTLPAGTYSFSASCSEKSWEGTISVSADGCSKMQLTN